MDSVFELRALGFRLDSLISDKQLINVYSATNLHTGETVTAKVANRKARKLLAFERDIVLKLEHICRLTSPVSTVSSFSRSSRGVCFGAF